MLRLCLFLFLVVLCSIVSSGTNQNDLQVFQPIRISKTLNLNWSIFNLNNEGSFNSSPCGSLTILQNTLRLDFHVLERRFQCTASRTPLSTQGIGIMENLLVNGENFLGKDFHFFQGPTLDKQTKCNGYFDLKNNALLLMIESEEGDVIVEPSFNDNGTQVYNHVVYRVNDLVDRLCESKLAESACLLSRSLNSRNTIRNKRNKRSTSPITVEEIKKITSASCPVDIVVTPSYMNLLRVEKKEAIGEIMMMFQLLDKWFSEWDYNFDGKPENFGISLLNLNFVLDDNHTYSPGVIVKQTGSGNAQEALLKYQKFREENPILFNQKTCFSGVYYGLEFNDYYSFANGQNTCNYPWNIWIGTRQNESNLKMSLVEFAYLQAHQMAQLMGGWNFEQDEEACKGDKKVYIEHANIRKPKDGSTETKMSPCTMKNRTYEAIRTALVNRCVVKKSTLSTGFCGNEFREDIEECDCGLTDCDKVDTCCTPPWSTVREGQDKPCTLRRKSKKAVCSRNMGPCCNEQCQFRNSSEYCLSPIDECGLRSRCSGSSSICSKPRIAPDGHPCQNGTKICEKGICQDQATVCSFWKLEACSCSKPNDDCQQCCKSSRGSACVPSKDIEKQFWEHEGLGLWLQDGTHCGNHGICRSGVCKEENKDIYQRTKEDETTRKLRLEEEDLSLGSKGEDSRILGRKGRDPRMLELKGEDSSRILNRRKGDLKISGEDLRMLGLKGEDSREKDNSRMLGLEGIGSRMLGHERDDVGNVGHKVEDSRALRKRRLANSRS